MIKINVEGNPLPKSDIEEMRLDVSSKRDNLKNNRYTFKKYIGIFILFLILFLCVEAYILESFSLFKHTETGIIMSLFGVILYTHAILDYGESDQLFLFNVSIGLTYVGGVVSISSLIPSIELMPLIMPLIMLLTPIPLTVMYLFKAHKLRTEEKEIEEVSDYLKEAYSEHEYILKELLDEDIIKSYVNKLDRKLLAIELDALNKKYHQIKSDKKKAAITNEVYPNLKA